MLTGSKKVATEELHLFIIWENARAIEDKILADIANNFKILKVYEVHWSESKFSENLSRFYGTQLPPNSRKEVHVGTNPFLAVIVEDQNPKYNVHTTTKGDKRVNSNLFTAKATHREWSGGGHKVHATNTKLEADHNLTLLFGKNTDDFLKDTVGKPSQKIEKWSKDLVGSNGWDSLEQLFYVLNNTIDYVVLRNFDTLPANYYAKSHGDIDLLVSDYKDACFIANSNPVFKSKYRIYNTVNIRGEKVYFDFRNINDNYYDPEWELAILANRKFNVNGFYTPSSEDHFYSLLYHAIIHKPELGEDYIKKLTQMASKLRVSLTSSSFESSNAIKVLSEFLRKNSYSFTQPNDKSVYFHMGNIQTGVKIDGVKFSKRKRIPLRNYLKKHKVPFKHYALKARKVARRHVHKLTGS
jgi:hypothetical protein